MNLTARELPVADHGLLLQARVNSTQEHYALVTIPRILSKTIMGWAQEYAERGGKFGAYMLDDLITRVQNPGYVEQLCIQEGVHTRFLEQAVEKIQRACLGEQA